MIVKWRDLVNYSVEGTQPPFRELVDDYREMLEVRDKLRDVRSDRRALYGVTKIKDTLEGQMEQKEKEIKSWLKEHLIDILVADIFTDLFWGDDDKE